MERYLGRRKWIDLGEEMTRNPHRLIHETLSELLQVEILKGSRHGAFHSAHELASVLREEYEEIDKMTGCPAASCSLIYVDY